MGESPKNLVLKPHPNFSISQINDYLTCPRRYEYKYVKGISPNYSAALLFGSSIHKGLEKNFSQKIFSREDLRASEVVDAFAEELDRLNKDTPVEWDGKYGEYKDSGRGLLRAYMTEYSKTLMPKLVEHRVEIVMPGVSKPIVGRIDLVTTSLGIIDFKTITRKPSVVDIKKNLLQLSSYSYSLLKTKENREVFSEEDDATLRNIKKFNTRLDYFVKPSTEIIPKPVPRTRDDLKSFVKIVQSICQSIDAGIFYPSINNALCNKKYCAYWDRCKQELIEDSYFREE